MSSSNKRTGPTANQPGGFPYEYHASPDAQAVPSPGSSLRSSSSFGPDSEDVSAPVSPSPARPRLSAALPDVGLKASGTRYEKPSTTPSRRSSGFALHMPIAARLTLGFLIAALISAIAAGVIGFERSQSLTKESTFYQHLLQTNTSLNTGANYLQLMNTKLHEVLNNAVSPAFSQETQETDEKALQTLTERYDAILASYVKNDFVDQHPEQMSLLTEAGNDILVQQQHTLVASVQRTWITYRAAQLAVLNDVNTKNGTDAQTLIRAQAEPTNADSLSAMRTLIQLGSSLATSINDAAVVEQQTLLITTIIIVAIACLCIGFFGWFISRTLVQRLHLLRHVTQLVERGQLDSRVQIIGSDEIADVSHSVNSMLDTIVGLLQETRSQRDAMTNAANHLFSYMQVVSAGELRTSTVAHSDPIGMLADAFNFTIGRVRRFTMRTQASVERLEVMLRQEMERAENFMQQVPRQSSLSAGLVTSPSAGQSSAIVAAKGKVTGDLTRDVSTAMLTAQLKQAQQHLLQGVRFLAQTYIRTMFMQTKQMSNTVQQIKQQYGQHRNRLENGQMEQDLQALELLMHELETAMQSMQTNASRELSEVEKLLTQSLSTLLQGAKETVPVRQTLTAEPAPVSEVVQLSVRFVQGSSALVRQIASVTQEMRNNVNNFKMDSDGPAPFSPSSVSGNLKL